MSEKDNSQNKVNNNTQINEKCFEVEQKNDSGSNFFMQKKKQYVKKKQNIELYSKNGSKKPKRSFWALKITVITFVLTVFFSFISEITSSAGNIIVAILLLIFLILANIVFDGIGVAVTACNLSPLVSMNSRRVYGAKTAVMLVKNAEKVSNICNDVIGDIFGIISGACSVAIVIKLLSLFKEPNQQLLTIALSSVVAALTVGGKAMIKEISIKNSKELVMFVSRILAVFSKEELKRRKKNTNKDTNDKK